jgi:hypothetical protein
MVRDAAHVPFEIQTGVMVLLFVCAAADIFGVF